MTNNILEYKAFIGSVNYSDDECFYGNIEGINDGDKKLLKTA